MADSAKKPKLVEVHWKDARTVYEQVKLRKAPEECLLVERFSLGYLVHKDRERVIIAHTFDPAEPNETEDGGADFTVIPRSWLVSITELAATGGTEQETP